MKLICECIEASHNFVMSLVGLPPEVLHNMLCNVNKHFWELLINYVECKTNCTDCLFIENNIILSYYLSFIVWLHVTFCAYNDTVVYFFHTQNVRLPGNKICFVESNLWWILNRIKRKHKLALISNDQWLFM